jgi:23S rRNA (pseudouridine1915-N3)-methyltransferase
VKILVLAIGRLKEDFWEAAEAEYRKRLRKYATLDVREVKDDDALLLAVPPRAKLILLDPRGENVSSEELAAFLRTEESHGAGDTLVFALGGPDGFGDAVRERTKKSFAFGRITLPHRLARVVLLEQLYRAYSILRGEPYHR